MSTHIGARRVDLERGEVEGHGVLGRRELALLRYFLEHPDRVIGQDELLSEVWGFSLRVRTRALYTAVYRLRMMLEVDPSDPQLIRSERGEGYRFSLPRDPGRVERLVPPVSPIYGRGELLRHLREMLAAGRLVTLVGGPGIGKSRVGQEIAHERRSAGLEVLAVRPGPSLLGSLCTAIGFTPGPRRSEVLEGLAAGLERRAPLLLLIDGPDDVGSEQVEELLELLGLTTEVKALVLSRSPLQVSGERVVEVEPLDADAATELLAARVGTHPSVERSTLARLAMRVEGVPLALELVAALIQTLGAASTLDLLGRSLGALAVAESSARPGLTAAVLRSWQSLSETEREQLLALVPFEGGFTLDQATGILGEAGIQAVAQLRTRSLVHLRGADRFAVFDTIREFVARIAPADALREARLRHAAWFAAAIRQTAPAIVLKELPNLEAAIDGLTGAGQVDEACALLQHLLSLPLPTDDRVRWATRGIEIALSEESRSHFETAVAQLLRRSGRLRDALQAADRALALARAPESRFLALHNQAEAGVALGEYAEAETAARLLQELAPDLPPARSLLAHLTLGRVMVHRDPEEAIRLVDSLQGRFGPADDRAWAYGEAIRGFALVRLDPAQAEAHLTWLDEWHQERGLAERCSGIRTARLHLLVRQGRAEDADRLQRDVGRGVASAAYHGLIRAWIEWLEGDVRRCRATLERTVARAEATRDGYTEALALAAMGQLAHLAGQLPQAEGLMRRAASRHSGPRSDLLAWLAAVVARLDAARARTLLTDASPERLGASCARWLLGERAVRPTLPAEHELVDRIGLTSVSEVVVGA